jgi:long-chain-fatty-acid--CoA ligase ACSBG
MFLVSLGENIPPLRVEERIKAQLPIVSQAVLIGDQRNYLTCLLTLKTEVDGEGVPTERLAPEVIEVLRGLGSQAVTLREAGADPRVQAYLMQGIERANREADSRAQHVQKSTVLPEEISVANGLLTPTLKMRRSLIEQKYQEEIRAMYAVPLTT